MVVSQEALGQLAHEYVDKITEHKANWTRLALTMLSLSRMVGAQAAHLARTEGSHMIERRHYTGAVTPFADEITTYFCCPFTSRCLQ